MHAARAVGPQVAVLIIALVVSIAFMGCGKKDDEAAGEGPPGMAGGGMMPGAPGGGMMQGGPGGGGMMPGAPGGGMMQGGGGMMQGGGGMMQGGGGMMQGGPPGGGGPSGPPSGGGAPSAKPDKPAGPAEPSPTGPTEVKPAPAPTPDQQQLVDDAVGILRTSLTADVPAPPPDEKEGAGDTQDVEAPEGSGSLDAASADPFRATDYRLAQAGPPGQGAPPGMPGMGGPMGAPGGGSDEAGADAAPSGDAASGVPPIAMALTFKEIAQNTRGIEMTEQKFYHEYWFFLAKSLLDEVTTTHSDFPVVQLTWAAQVKSDWEGYLWHWAVRKMMEQTDYPGLEDVGKDIAKARVGLATLRAISRYGLLMHDVDRTKLGRLIYPTVEHIANCVQLAYGNSAFDPATIKRPEDKRSRLMIEVFDNYFKWGHNWWWERSRNWAQLARVSENLPAYVCDSCGCRMTRDHQMWRCPRCGKASRPAVPGTVEVVEPNACIECGYTDQYRTFGLQCPACETGPSGKYRLRRAWNSPTFARRQQGLKNAQHVHARLDAVFASNFPTQADRDAYEAWLKASPAPERVPDLHRMELEAHEMRLRAATIPSATQPQRN